jgi:short-subunit dehydrogenase
MSSAYRAVLTGATGGIGRAMAQALASRSDHLVLVARDAARLAVLAAELRECHPTLAIRAVAADLATDAGREAVVAAALEAGADVLINNAGITDFTLFADQSTASVERILATNALAPMLLTRALLPQLTTRRRAHVVNVGSVFGLLGYPGWVSYCASKFALHGFSEALRRELADTSIRVHYLAPRATVTALNNDAMCAMNRELGNAMDDPARVAAELLKLLDGGQAERVVGFPEKLFARLNRFLPGVVDRALRRQLPVIRRYATPNTETLP